MKGRKYDLEPREAQQGSEDLEGLKQHGEITGRRGGRIGEVLYPPLRQPLHYVAFYLPGPLRRRNVRILGLSKRAQRELGTRGINIGRGS